MKPQILSVSILTILLAATFSIASAQKTYPKDISDRIYQVEHNLAGSIRVDGDPKWTVEDRMTFFNVPGLSIAIVKDYKIEWAKGYGWMDKARKIPVSTETLFQAASISKSLNSVGVLALVQKGKINLNEDINKYLKSWKFPYDSLSKNKKITIYNLLTHTAGLSVHGFPGYAKTSTLPTVVQILDGANPANTQAVRSEFEPGLKFQYSGGGTTISQLLVMDATGQPYDKYMKTNVLDPLGMHSSFYTQPPPADKAQLATGYRPDGKEIEGNFMIHPEAAAAGLWTNPTDLCKYIIETQLALQGKSSKVLSRETTKTRLTPFPESGAALGVFIEKHGTEQYFTHGGSNQGFRCNYIGSMENGNGVVVMVNSDNGEILNELVNSVATVYQWKDFYNPTIKTIIAVPDNVLASYVGEYQIAPQFSLVITKQGSSLQVEPTGQPRLDLFAEGTNVFFLKVVDAQLEFVANTEGKIEKLILHQNGRNMDGKKVK
ncbi:MAG TPA: serine hydrolase [Chryseolinea sp.]|nr:serine hydrolase [Chryseolinea sp.]